MEDLLKDSPKNWGKWGPDDEVGASTTSPPRRCCAACSTSSPARSSPCSGRSATRRATRCGPAAPRGAHEGHRRVAPGTATTRPAVPRRPALRRRQDRRCFLQGSTQYDALGHVWYDGQIWNGYDARTTVGGLAKASVAPIAERGRRRSRHPARHGPLPRQGRPRQGRDLHPRGPRWPAPRPRASTIEKHDILIIRTGFVKLFFEQGDAFYEGFVEPGLTYSPELVQWFHDMEIPNLVTDTIANEVTTDPDSGRRAAAAQRADAQPRRRR